MRIYFHLSPNTTPVPFNYQSALVGAMHRWLGHNELHDSISLYSLSWLSGGMVRRKALDFPGGSTFWISAPDDQMLARLVSGVADRWEVRWGMEVERVSIQRTPEFGESQRFVVQSPVLVQRRNNSGKQSYFLPGEDQTNEYLTETLQHKMKKAGLNLEASVVFDPEYKKTKTKLVDYKGIKIKAALCPILVSGHPRAVQFAWEVGAGNSTGIGFGALK